MTKSWPQAIRKPSSSSKFTSPVAWRNVNLIGNFDFTTSTTPVDIEALAARYQQEDFWRRSMSEGDDDSHE
jgi:hypothetical protein